MDLNYSVAGHLERGSRAHHLLIPPSKFLAWLMQSVDHTPSGLVVVPHILKVMAGNQYPEDWPNYLYMIGACRGFYRTSDSSDVWCVKPEHQPTACGFQLVKKGRIQTEGTINVHLELQKHLQEWEPIDPCQILD